MASTEMTIAVRILLPRWWRPLGCVCRVLHRLGAPGIPEWFGRTVARHIRVEPA